jgi:diguanylate cyclase (GGDEF)-like protein
LTPTGAFRLLLLVSLVSLMIVGAVLATIVALRIDQDHKDLQRAALIAAINDYRAGFAESVAALAARWSAAHASPGAPAELGQLAGASRYRYQRLYLIDAKGRLVAGDPPAEAVPAPIARVLAVLGDRRQITGDEARIAPPVTPATGLVLLDDGPAFAAVAAVSDTAEGDAEVGAMVAIVPFDQRLIGRFERAAGVYELRFATDAPKHAHNLLAQLDTQGRIVGWFSWETRLPISGAFGRYWPAIATLMLAIVALTALGIGHFSHRVRTLSVDRRRAQTMADRDALTGLLNRGSILDTLDRALVARSPDEVVSLSIVDLDGFKEVNESLGHEAGDQLLAVVAARLTGAVPPSAAVGRIGSDEFAVVMTAGDYAVAIEAAAAIGRALEETFFVGEQAVAGSASIGVSQAPRDGATRNDLMRRADLAARSAKRRGRGRVVGFDRDLEEQLRERRFIRSELQRALAECSLDVHYQPIVAADGLGIVGAEGLLRWTHPTRGNIPPSVFVPIAEEAGLMVELGEFVLRRALVDARGWRDLFVSVNISPVQMRDRALVDLVASAIIEAGIPASRVVLEITEGVLIENPEEVRQRLKELRALGLKIALDDFGSGYSSLSYLRRLPIDKLKIDREFVKPLGHSADGGVIIQAMIGLGHALGLSVLAEGVETEEQRVLLRLAGCDEMQGFLFGRPAPRTVMDKLAATGKVTTAPVLPDAQPRRHAEAVGQT